MSGPSRILFRAAVTMISDGVIVSGWCWHFWAMPICGENRRTGRCPWSAGYSSSCDGDHCGSRRVMGVSR
jgi:hypothetical protein